MEAQSSQLGVARNSIGGHYASKNAELCSAKRRIQARLGTKLLKESVLFGNVHHPLFTHLSPLQISKLLSGTAPRARNTGCHTKTSTTASPWALRRILIKALDQAHNKRETRSKGEDRRFQIPDMVSIHIRHPAIEDSQCPDHVIGDLIKGEANGSAMGTPVERTSRLLMFIKLTELRPASALNVLQGCTDKHLSVAVQLRMSMTYD